MNSSFSSSFSDSINSNQPVHSRKINHVQKEKAALLQKNIELTNQMTNLRKQFDQALDVSSKIDNFYSANSEYAKEISRLKAEKDDLYRRLQIALQTNQDLNNKLHNFHSMANNQCSPENSEFFKQQRNQFENIISDLRQKLENSEKENERLKQNCEQTKMMLESVFQAAGHHFDCLVDSPSALLECLVHANSSCEAENIKKLTKHISKLTKKLKKKQSLIEDLQKGKQQILLRQKQTVDSENEFKIFELTTQLNDLKERSQAQTQQVDELTRKNAALLDEIAQKNSQLKFNTFQAEDKQAQENQHLSVQLTAAQTQLDSVCKKNKQTKKKLFVIAFKAKSLEKKVKELTNMVKSLEDKKIELKNEIQRNIALHTQSEFRIKDVENSVLRAQDELALQKKENDKLKDEIAELIEKLKQSEREFKEVRSERDHLSSQITGFENKLQNAKDQLETQAQTYESKLQSAKEIKDSLEKQLKEALNPLDTQTLVPPSLLNSPDFPNDLQTLLGEIGRNTALNLTIRIQSAFSTISKFYRTLIDQTEQKLTEEHQQASSLKTQVDSLLDFLRRLMPEVRINFELLLSDEQTRNFLGDAIRNLKDIQRLQPMIEAVNAALNIPKFDDAKDSIEQMKVVMKKLQNHVFRQKEQKKKFIRLSKLKEEEFVNELHALEGETKELEQKIRDCEEQKSQLQNQIFEIQQQSKQNEDEITKNYENRISDLNSQVNELQLQIKEIKTLEETISKLNRRREILEDEIKLRHSQAEEDEKKFKQRIKTEKDKYDQMTEQTRKQMAELQAKIRELSEMNSRVEATNDILTANNNEMTLRIQKLETRNTAIQSEFDRDKKSLESQFTAKMVFAETEFKSRIEEKQLQIDVIKKRLVESISRSFSSYLDGLRVDENNFEGALQVLRRKLDTIFQRESNIRTRFQLDPRQPLDEALAAIVSKKRKKNIY
ncbi:hypothetical protein TRFO_18099 [Tritrichomonas foetus]|uniref:Uncharacterized protein n=1 Tax=Tritrichomonas foetus TaxID=1144522 RepID=A0A1J4KQX1_9EUKA|nr:hypothetical protein TRFO_18099 [Tritrichomonas foetus]|eukprot:OHT12196.1 hypothetical protein TRFO_18099 [Tritrichomonas foetus]